MTFYSRNEAYNIRAFNYDNNNGKSSRLSSSFLPALYMFASHEI